MGIDQSLTSTGIAILRGSEIFYDLIQPRDNVTGVQRLAYIRDKVKEYLDTYSPCVHVCIEGASYNSKNRADDLGQLRGVLKLSFHDWGIPRTTIPPTVLKKFGARRGDVSKEKMLRAAEEEFEIMLGKQDDIADALWLAKLAMALKKDIKLTRPQLEVVHGIRNPKPKQRTIQTSSVLDI